jgi:hypothetical protein
MDILKNFCAMSEVNGAWRNHDEGRMYTWEETFKLMGFNTYKDDGEYHWLDDYEYTFFVLRYS